MGVASLLQGSPDCRVNLISEFVDCLERSKRNAAGELRIVSPHPIVLDNDTRCVKPLHCLVHDDVRDPRATQREDVAIEDAIIVGLVVEDPSCERLRDRIATMLSCRAIYDERFFLQVGTENMERTIPDARDERRLPQHVELAMETIGVLPMGNLERLIVARGVSWHPLS